MPCFCPAVKTEEGKLFPHKRSLHCDLLRDDEEAREDEYADERRADERERSSYINQLNRGTCK